MGYVLLMTEETIGIIVGDLVLLLDFIVRFSFRLSLGLYLGHVQV